MERGGSWVVAQTEPGWGDRERQLKQHGAARRCEVCKAVEGYQAGELEPGTGASPRRMGPCQRARTRAPARHVRPLPASGEHVGTAGLAAGHADTAAGPADGEVRAVPAPRPAPAAQYITPEIVALVDQLQQSWTRETTPRPDAQAPQAAAEPEMEPQA